MTGRGHTAALMLLATLALAGCNTTDALTPIGSGAPSAPASTGTTPETTGAAQLAAIPAGAARIQVAEIVGAPRPAVEPLNARLVQQASGKSFAVVPQGDPTATHTLKGFFSASPEGRETTIFYVWDVIDKAGNRVHRFSGQETAPGASADGWSVVTETTLQAIADRTVTDLSAWLSGTAG